MHENFLARLRSFTQRSQRGRDAKELLALRLMVFAYCVK
jgi:hypothetical protein